MNVCINEWMLGNNCKVLWRADYGPMFTQHKDHVDASTQSWTFMVLHQVLVSGPITALAAASPQRKVTIFGRRTSVHNPLCVVWTRDHNQPLSGHCLESPFNLIMSRYGILSDRKQKITMGWVSSLVSSVPSLHCLLEACRRPSYARVLWLYQWCHRGIHYGSRLWVSLQKTAPGKGISLGSDSTADASLMETWFLSRLLFHHHLSFVSFHSKQDNPNPLYFGTLGLYVFNFLSCSCAPYFQSLSLHLIVDVIFRLFFPLRLYPTRSFFLGFLPSLFPGFLPSFCPSFPPQTLPPFSHCYEMLLRMRDRAVTLKALHLTTQPLTPTTTHIRLSLGTLQTFLGAQHYPIKWHNRGLVNRNGGGNCITSFKQSSIS